MVQLGIEPRTSRVLGERDNHYTTEPTACKATFILLDVRYTFKWVITQSRQYWFAVDITHQSVNGMNTTGTWAVKVISPIGDRCFLVQEAICKYI